MCQGNGEVIAAHPFCVIFILIISYLPKVMNGMYNKNMSFQLLAFKVNSYVIISQKNLPFSGKIEIPNLKGEQSIGKKNGKCR